MDEVQRLTKYYMDQSRTGGSLFYSGPIYKLGSGCFHRGSGIGNYISGFFRRVIPILRRGTIAVGKEVINTGSNLVGDIVNNVSPRTAFKNRTREGMNNLAKKVMDGHGYKRRAVSGKQHSKKTAHPSKKRKITKKKSVQQKKKKKIVKRKSKDIFTS